jgi:energy-coupling factor transporter ATP-binding protein EcfA2
MTDRNLHIQEFRIDRALGIGPGAGFARSELSPCVNLVIGPNSSGKSTLALVLQEMLWPGQTGLERPTVSGDFTIGEDLWRVDIDAGNAEHTRNGESSGPPDLGPPEIRHRYRINLEEQFRHENQSFAKYISDISQGGYDLELAAKALKFTDRPSTPQKLAGTLRAANKDINNATAEQRQIQAQSDSLHELRTKRKETIKAETRIGLLEHLIESLEAADRCRQITAEIDVLPKGVTKLHGDEREQLDQIKKRSDRARGDLTEQEEKVKHAEDDLQKSKLPEEEVPQETLATLSASVNELRGVESRIREQSQRAAESNALADTARQRLGDNITDEQLAALESVQNEDVSTFASMFSKLKAQRDAIGEQRRWIDGEEPEEVRGHDTRQLLSGITALGHWLASPTQSLQTSPRMAWLVWIAAAITVLLSFALAVLNHIAWGLVALIGLGIGFGGWWVSRTPKGSATDPRGVHKASYESTGLTSPATWNPSAIAEAIRQLCHLMGIRTLEDERSRRSKDLEVAEEALQTKENQLNQKRIELQDRLGLRIEPHEDWLPLMVSNIGDWQKHSATKTASDAALSVSYNDQVDLLKTINDLLAPFGYSPVESADAASELVDDLRDRDGRRKEAVSRRDDGRDRIQGSLKPNLEATVKERLELLESLGLTVDGESDLDDWLAEYPKYRDLKDKLVGQEAIRDSHRKTLSEYPDIRDLDLSTARDEVEDLQSTVAERDSIVEQIAKIETAIQLAKQGNTLSEALEARDRIASELEDAREQNVRSAIGGLLVRWVRTVAIDKARPEVFQRANNFLEKFTLSKLNLDLDDSVSPPVFRVRCDSKPIRTLDQLSAGVQVQVEIAIRIAFIELNEQIGLPVIMDEALGNSDDKRAPQIIKTVCELAKQGRQVFYLTAQHDEIEKWIVELNAAKLSYKLITLVNVID